MKRAVYLLMAFIITICTGTHAVLAGSSDLPQLVDIRVEEIPGYRYMIIIYEAEPWMEPDFTVLIEAPFVFEEDLFHFQYISIEENVLTDTKWGRTELAFPVDNDDLHPVLQQLQSVIPYNDEDGYSGWLDLDYTAVWIQPAGQERRNFTMTDTITINGLISNDSSNIPKTRDKNGVTMTLQNVDWTVQQATTVGYESIPSLYTAVAFYSAGYSRQVTTGYIANAWYGGEGTRSNVDKITYSITYAAEVPIIGDVPITETERSSDSPDDESRGLYIPPEPYSSERGEEGAIVDESEDEEVPTDGNRSKGSSKAWIPILIAFLVLLLAGGCVLAYFHFHDIQVYYGSGGELKLISRRRINLDNPVIDLRRNKLTKGNVTIWVRERAASKLYGRQILVVFSNDFTHTHTVKRKFKDYRFVVTIPDEC